MPENSEVVDTAPTYISCAPLSRQFPLGWRDVRFRRSAIRGSDGVARYQCPICKHDFDHTDIDFLEGDHIWPYSLFGESTWANYQLICGSCNARKRDFIDDSIRSVLGSGQFRKAVCECLRIAVRDGRLDENEMTSLLLLRAGIDDEDQ